MKIVYLGKELNSLIEHEIFSENEFGFVVRIKYIDNSRYNGKYENANNITEFHWMYNDLEDGKHGTRVAFESDIFRTGFTRECSDIDTIEIVLAYNKYEKF